MRSTIINPEVIDSGVPRSVLEKLPYRLSDAIRREMRARNACCEEIRVRCGRMSSLTLPGGINLPLDVSLSREEMDETVNRLCGGSLYAHAETIKNGYISLRDGIRAGISGRAAVENGRVIGVSDVSGICIRIPRFVRVGVSPICELLKDSGFSSGVLVYSPPGVGKTTLLRQVAMELSRGEEAVSVVVVDSRGELEFGLRSRYICADVLSGYPKAEGIEIALRTLGARVIVCDEIGNDDEIPAICSAAAGGAALLASAHASDMRGLMSKPGIRQLHLGGVFGAYVGIRRSEGGFAYRVTRREEVEGGA